jgi:hypothetical protein
VQTAIFPFDEQPRPCWPLAALESSHDERTRVGAGRRTRSDMVGAQCAIGHPDDAGKKSTAGGMESSTGGIKYAS